jgi:hypothetical protein
VLAIANHNDWLSGEHFSVDGTLIQAWAGHKSFGRRDGSDDDSANFKGQSRCNDTHESSTDADARLYRKGNTASELRFMGHTLSDNRHGLIASAVVTTADGHAEREAAKAMIADAKQAAPDNVAKSEGYAISQQKRKLIEQGFGWAKLVGPIRQVMVRGLKKVDQLFVLTMAAYNLTRMRTLGQIRSLAA